MSKFWNFILSFFKKQENNVVANNNLSLLDEEYEGWLGI